MTFNFYSRLKKLHIKGESRDKDPALIKYNSIIALSTQALHPKTRPYILKVFEITLNFDDLSKTEHKRRIILISKVYLLIDF